MSKFEGIPVTRSYVDVFFRHKFILILPVVLAFLAGTLLAFTAPRQYVASASVWTDTRVPDESTVGTTGGQNPPSAGQASLLTQLLATRAFLQEVIQVSPLAAEFTQADKATGDRMLTDLGASVSVYAAGPQLMSVNVTRTEPDEATGVASAVLQQFDITQVNDAKARAKAQLAYDKKRLDAAQSLVNRSRNDAAEDAFATAAQAYNESQLNLAAVEATSMRVVDEPASAGPKPRAKSLLFGAFGGAVAGLTLSLLLLIAFMARDRSLRGEETALEAGLDIVGIVPKAAHTKQRTHPSLEEALGP